MRFLFTLILALMAAMPLRAEYLEADTLNHTVRTDSLPPLKGNWVQQLMATNFHINDPRIRYPKFVNFCRLVYNWGDHTFNTYNKDYVIGTGKNWKFYLVSNNWSQSYGYIFPQAKITDNVLIRSSLNSDFGFSLNFMAVSVGYTWNVNQWITGNSAPRKTFNFAFNCSLFSAELMHNSTSGNARITRWGAYNDSKRLNIKFDKVQQQETAFSAYYFFNHFKYSQSAAYAFSKYQLKSAGTWVIGVHLADQNIYMDFSDLPKDMLDAVPQLPAKNDFKFRDYNLMGGYAYNWVLPHKWLFNITVLPSVGLRWSKIHTENRSVSQMISVNGRVRASLTYNHRAFFANLQGRFDGGFIFDKSYSFFNSTQSAQVLLGVRF